MAWYPSDATTTSEAWLWPNGAVESQAPGIPPVSFRVARAMLVTDPAISRRLPPQATVGFESSSPDGVLTIGVSTIALEASLAGAPVGGNFWSELAPPGPPLGVYNAIIRVYAHDGRIMATGLPAAATTPGVVLLDSRAPNCFCSKLEKGPVSWKCGDRATAPPNPPNMISVSIELVQATQGPIVPLQFPPYEPTATTGGILVSVDVPVIVNYTP